MAIGWVSLLKSVPWTQVIERAPQIAEGAQKLWAGAARKWGQAEAPPAAGLTAEQRLQALETAVGELKAQLVASSELIDALAEQNAQLVRRLEIQRRRLLPVALAALAAGLVALLLLAFQRVA